MGVVVVGEVGELDTNPEVRIQEVFRKTAARKRESEC